ncbi:MAG: methyl-accepting chemotaxis protein, partial [Pseudomonadota bacterium]
SARHLAEAQTISEQLSLSQDLERQRFDEQSRAIGTLSEGLHALSNGRLDVQLTQSLADEYEPLRERFNLAVSQMEKMVATIIGQADQMGGVVSIIQSGTQDLSARTEEQSATLMETASSLETLVVSVDQTAAHATEANTYVDQTRQSAAKSGEVLARTVEAMTRIKGSSDHISENLSVIDDIAFQTNLLALNAGVEAARAGEAGRGFAVVASEVRALAQRASEASEEIGRLIAASRAQVNEGVDLMGQTEETLTQMTNQFVTVAELMAKIGSSTQDQTGRLHDINRSVAELDNVTQQNAAMAEETFGSTINLMGETERLGAAARHFSCGQSKADAAPKASAA